MILGRGLAQAQDRSGSAASFETFVTGLQNPRGLKFGPQGELYVAEAGTVDSSTSASLIYHLQPGFGVPAPVGPYIRSNPSAGITRIDPNGDYRRVADGLPSTQSASAAGGYVIGIADVALLDSSMYGLLAGGGGSHGYPPQPGIPPVNWPNGVYRIDGNGSHLVADLSHFLQTHPVAHPNPDDFEPDGTWYSMVAANENLYALEPNHGELDRITPDGAISRVADISATDGHSVPAALAFSAAGNSGGSFYVGTLGTFPVRAGSAKIFRVTPDGQISTVADGLTALLGIALDGQGRLYALETTTVDGAEPLAGTGRVVRIEDAGSREIIAQDLTFPTALAFGPDGLLYVSEQGYGATSGRVIRMPLPTQAASLAAPEQHGEQPDITAQANAPCVLATRAFSLLQERLPRIVGDCLGPPVFDALTGDVSQPTHGGELRWRYADQQTMFSNDAWTWLDATQHFGAGLQGRPKDERFDWEPDAGLFPPATYIDCLTCPRGGGEPGPAHILQLPEVSFSPPPNAPAVVGLRGAPFNSTATYRCLFATSLDATDLDSRKSCLAGLPQVALKPDGSFSWGSVDGTYTYDKVDSDGISAGLTITFAPDPFALGPASLDASSGGYLKFFSQLDPHTPGILWFVPASS
jgi:hypothetical protein